MNMIKLFPEGKYQVLTVDDNNADSHANAFSFIANIELNSAVSLCFFRNIIPDAEIVCYYSSNNKSGSENTCAMDCASDDCELMYGPVLLVKIQKGPEGWRPTAMTAAEQGIILRELQVRLDLENET